jgi:hypothetical protein
MKKKTVKNALIVSGVAVGSFLLGWRAYIYVCDNIPYSYRTDNPILDLLGAVGIRDYADIDLSKED